MNEEQTKLDLITPALQKAGWGVVSDSRIVVEHPITNENKPGVRNYSQLRADYVLEYKNRRIGVVEAKRRNLYYTDGVGQAKDYATRLNIRYTYATNGLQIYAMDMDEGTEGDVKRYPTPDELWEMTFPTPVDEYKVEIDAWRAKLFAVPFEDKGGLWKPRYYQNNAITKTLDAIANKKDRILLTLATGTGKTAIAFQIAWKLFHAKWNLKRDGSRSPRILFLADRNILADQAFNSFGAFEEDALVRIYPGELPSQKELEGLKKGTIHSIRKKGKVPKNGNIFFTIFQTFLSGSDEISYYEEYPKDFFDLIIIDECHRGGANDESSWRDILEYFSPAVQLGLTATPKRDENGDTYDYFGDPAYIYSLKEGINDGFLTPFRVEKISTTIDEYTYTGDDDIELVGDDGEAIAIGTKFTEEDMNRIIEIKEREAYRVSLFMDMIDQNHKTLVFCATQIHALAVRDLINQYATSKSANYCHRVTADDGKLGEQHLRDFQDNEKSIPTVLTTSQKLSTGVDAPEIRNIVLMRPVKSMVEFKQIVGRGTRLFDNKDYFTVLDFVKAHEHFNDEEWDGPPLAPAERPQVGDDTKKPCEVCGKQLCICEKERCSVCDNDPCVCDDGPKKIIKVTLADNKVRKLDSMVETTFWSASGMPMSASEFMKQLHGDLPAFFKSEAQLRKIWSLPSTRSRLLSELKENGYNDDQLHNMKLAISAAGCDIFDVLNYVAYNKDVLPRLERANKAKIMLFDYDPDQQAFLNFVLDQYVKEGVKELDIDKLSELLKLKYNAIADAKEVLGDIQEIRENFIGFQEYLYQDDVA